ncbi:acyl-CoA thioesterase [Plantactinospora sonchi]|uniref:Thioesterase family protein n=1 Tax=Plantactinospora sonchi TaxID=1544735 RepID=A0ABU7RWB2_9ACTN
MTAVAPSVEYGQLEIVPVYFDDLDAMGIVHHARYALLFDRALSGYWGRQGYEIGAAQSEDSFQAVRELTLSYLAPIRRTGEIAVHLWLNHLGRTSLEYGFRIRSLDGATTYAEGRRAMVRLDPASMRPTPFTESGREALGRLLRPAAEQD